MISVHDGTHLHYTAYLAGAYGDHRFTPETEGKLDHGGSFYAPQVFVDDAGRRVMFGWLREGRDAAAQLAAGWSGVMSLPRLLTLLPDGTLGQEPAPELATLRRDHWRLADVEIAPASEIELAEARSDALEIVAEFEPGDAATVGLKVRCSPDGDEHTSIAYDPVTRQVTLDTRRSSLDADAGGAVRTARLELAPSEALRLHIFLDRSVIEVFANDRVCITERIYPTRPHSLGLDLFATGGRALLRSLDVRQMASIWADGD